ncbi:MAG: DUF3347 domain-containing protein [Flavobacteriales bacterium]
MRTLNLFLLLPAVLLLTSCSAQIKNVATATVPVQGNCGMCEKAIEKAALVKGEAQADWNKDTKLAVVTYDSTRTSLDAVLERIAQAGYDNERYLAPDKVYAGLDGCCQYERTGKHEAAVEDSPQHDAHKEEHGHEPTEAVPSAGAMDPMTAVFEHYFALKNALVASNAPEAKEHAEGLDGAMHSVDVTKLPADQQAMWTEVMKATMPSLHPLSGSTDLEQQRTLFAKLAAPMAQLAKAVPQAAPIYLDHCPMYNGGADWLSQEKGIKNPYYGSMMLTCGSVQETIAK